MTYEEAIELYQKRHKHPAIQTCWIAEIKRHHGTTTRKAWNSDKQKKRCPPDVWPNLEKILKELGMI